MENSAKSFDVFGFKEEELPNMVVTRVCSESVASEALNIHRALENEYFNIGGMSRFDDGEQINSRNQELFHHVRPNVLSGRFNPSLECSSSPGTASPEDNQHAFRESQSNDDSVDAVSDTDESMNVNSRTPSASPANHDLCEDGPSSENCQSHWEMVIRTAFLNAYRTLSIWVKRLKLCVCVFFLFFLFLINVFDGCIFPDLRSSSLQHAVTKPCSLHSFPLSSSSSSWFNV
nr:probable ubiquitin-like-specific protease 2B isoform X1 [Ipomoea batatas]